MDHTMWVGDAAHRRVIWSGHQAADRLRRTGAACDIGPIYPGSALHRYGGERNNEILLATDINSRRGDSGMLERDIAARPIAQ